MLDARALHVTKVDREKNCFTLESCGKQGNLAATKINVILLLEDGRWQEWNVLELMMEANSKEELESWVAALPNARDMM